MLNYIWASMLVVSFAVSFANGRVGAVCSALTAGANDAVQLALGIAGVMALWTGIMKIAERSALTDIKHCACLVAMHNRSEPHRIANAELRRHLADHLRRLFPDCAKNPSACGAIAMNITANFFGMGNAATPLGIKAMKELAKCSKDGSATNSMCMLAVVNSASIQLIPSTLIAVRSSLGSRAPTEIIVPIWITSAVVFASGVICAKIAEGRL